MFERGIVLLCTTWLLTHTYTHTHTHTHTHTTYPYSTRAVFTKLISEA